MKLYYDFSAILLIATVIAASLWAGDAIFFRKQRKAGVKAPLLVEYAKSFFPILLAVFVLRAYIFEPFRIPSGSMKPTLLEGDFILVNKYIYGLRLPLTGTKIMKMGEPKRGDVMVFRYPKDTSLDFIKRVVGVPGDKIRYEDKKLYVNDQLMKQDFIEHSADIDLQGRSQEVRQYSEDLNGIEHMIWVNGYLGSDTKEIIVPQGHYFMMGDNRDYSEDSRVWGFVPESLILGKAFYVWMSWDSLNKDVRWKRVGQSIA